MSKTNAGNFFEDFTVGRVLNHATPLTLTTGDASLYRALYGTRYAVQSADSFAQAIGYRPRAAGRSAWSSTLFSARPFPTSRSMPWPISATRKGCFMLLSIPATR
jgi:hypothetical protein